MDSAVVVTALFDIGREKFGDGRSVNQYLSWFEKTLKLKSRMVIYTEKKFRSFITERRDPKYTKIKIQDLEEIPLYKHREKIGQILKDPEYLSKIKDNSRIECRLDLYNVIQYSKFCWLQEEIKEGLNSDFYFWMDAGCSRFFSGANLSQAWPDLKKIDPDKFIIQGNINTSQIYPLMDIEEYKWDNNCILAGTLFGGKGDLVSVVSELAIKILEEEMLENRMINNEQIALAILFKRNPELFSVYINLNGEHLPLFSHLIK